MTIPDEQIIKTDSVRCHPLYQFAADVVVSQPEALSGVFHGMIDSIYDWVQDRLKIPLDKSLRQCDGYVLGDALPPLVGEAIFDEYLWSIRLTQTSPPFEGQKPIAERTWSTDFALRYDGINLRLGIQINSISTGQAIGRRVQCGKPTLIDQLASHHGLRDVRRLDGLPWRLEKKNDLNRFFDFLTSSKRTLPVILLTQIDRKRHPYRKFSFTLNDLEMAKQGIGIAHITCLPNELEAEWAKKIGPLSARQGAIRIYWPHLSLDKDSPSMHPIAVPNRPGPWPGIERLDWQYSDGSNEKEFRSFLLNEALRYSAMQTWNWSDFLFCREIQARRYQLKREQDAEQDKRRMEELAKIESKDVLCDELSKEVDRLKKRVEQLKTEQATEIDGFEQWLRENKEQLEESHRQSRSCQRQLEDVKTDNHYLRLLNDSLRTSLRTKTGQDQEDVFIPDNFDEIDEWVKNYLAGRLVLVPKAAHEARRATYNEVKLVYQALLLLAGPYRDMKLASATEEVWETERAQLGLRFGPSISETELGKYKDDYYVEYPVHSGKKRLAEYHLRKGTSREERYCLAIYFFWDDETKQVVVGWLPSHLENRLS